MSMPQLQNLGLSGYAWVGVDVGGFTGNATGELLTRWTEFGAFQPFCRNHSAWNTRPQEPWAFGERYEQLIRGALQLRQRLVPYLYSLFEEASRTGAPILRPLLFAYPEDEATFSADDEFMLGDALLVAPIARPGTEYRHVYLPRGTWVHYWSGEVVRGPTHGLVHAPLGQPALYVRANTPVPLWPAMSYDGERAPDPLTWLVHVADGAAAGSFTLYEDAGEGYGYLQGEFSRSRATCSVSGSRIELRLDAAAGAYRAERDRVELEIGGVTSPRTVLVDSRDGDWEHDGTRLLVRVSPAAEHVLEIQA